MDLLSTLLTVSNTEFIPHLGVESLISLYLTSTSLREMLERWVPDITRAHGIGNSDHSFSSLISHLDRHSLTVRTHLHIGVNRAFVRAGAMGDIEVLSFLQERGANYYKEAIEESIQGNHLPAVKYLCGADGCNSEYLTLAAHCGHEAIFKFFLQEVKVFNVYRIAEALCESGKLEMFEEAKNHFTECSCAYNAARGSHLHILELLPPNYIYIMQGASRGGHIDLVREMLEKGADDYDNCMYAACDDGHMDVVHLMLEKGANNYNVCSTVAARSGHLDILRLMIEKGANNYHSCNVNASRHGHTNIVRYMIENDTIDYQVCLYNGCQGGHLDIVQLALPHCDKDDINQVLYEACLYGYLHIVKYLLGSGATDVNTAIIGAIEGKHVDIVTLMLERGADNINEYTEVIVKCWDDYGRLLELIPQPWRGNILEILNTDC